MDSNIPIDVVITWVDGNDPEHRKKREKYTDTKIRFEDIDGETRYVSVGEIAWCIASINRFAPFVRKIFIVTDNQNPGIYPENGGRVSEPDSRYPLSTFLAKNFEHPIPMEIVDHKVIFKGWEQYLPTFNSLAIETMLCRIPGLSDQFVYFNDDVVLIRPTSPSTFFNGDKTCIYGYWHAKWTASLLRYLRKKDENGHKPFTFRDSLLNGADVSGQKFRFWRLSHTPHALDRRILEKFYDKHPEAVIRNIKHRFRNSEQYNPQAMFQNLAIRQHKAELHPVTGITSYMMPKKKNMEVIRQRMGYCENIPSFLFLCVNSLDQAEPQDRQFIMDWVTERIGLKVPYSPTGI